MNNTSEKIAAVIKKIEQLRALSKGAGTQAEAEAAATKAELLIAQYHIDEATLEAKNGTSESVEEGETLHQFGKQVAAWIGNLAVNLSKLHGCYVIADSADSTHPRIRIFGRQSDVAIVRYLFGWLTYEIDRLAQRESGRADRNAFRLGAVRGVALAMRRAQQEAFAGQQTASTTQGGKSTAMVLVSHSDEARALAMRTLKISKTVKKAAPRVKRSSMDALLRGIEAGDGLTPRAGLNAGTPTPLLAR